MIRITALFISSVVAFAALIKLKEHTWVAPPIPISQVQHIAAPRPAASASPSNSKRSSNAAAKIVGKYYLDRDITAKWFLVDNATQRDGVVKFLEKQPDVMLEFDGSTFRLVVDGAPHEVPFKPLEVTDTYIKVALPINDVKKPNTYFIQWDKLGFWLSRYTSIKKDGEKILFRQRFVRL